MQHLVGIRGAGRVQLPAYGLADAEHQVEKEIRALWPEAAVAVLDVARSEGGSRIVEKFRIRYRVQGTLAVTANTEDEARKSALRVLRERFNGSRFELVTWDVVPPPA